MCYNFCEGFLLRLLHSCWNNWLLIPSMRSSQLFFVYRFLLVLTLRHSSAATVHPRKEKNKGVYSDVGSFFCVLLHFDK